jgi:hypothetical protein
MKKESKKSGGRTGRNRRKAAGRSLPLSKYVRGVMNAHAYFAATSQQDLLKERL